MGSVLSQEADTYQQNEVSPTKPSSQTHENNHSMNCICTRLNNFPHECQAILKHADTVIDKLSIDQLYTGVFLNKRRKKYWVDKATNGNCFFVYARDLSIISVEDKSYWNWLYIKETSVHGKFDISKLTPGIKYEVVFVVMLTDRAYGWEVPINIKLTLPNGNKQHKENLMEKPRSKWFEIQVGVFIVEPRKGGSLEFALYEYEGVVWKKGLLVKGAAIRPKIKSIRISEIGLEL